MAFDEPGVAGVGRVEEPVVLVVGLVGGEQSGAVPGLDGGGVHAEMVGDLGDGEQAAGAEPVGVAGEVVAAADVEHDRGGEGLAFAGAVTGGVERVGGLGVGVVVEEPVEHGDGVGVGLAGLPGAGRDRDGQAGGLAAAEPDVQVDAGRSCCMVTSSMSRRAMRLRSRCGVAGFVHRAGKSVASARIRAWCSSVERGVAAALALVVVVLGGLQRRGARCSSRLPGCRRRAGCRGRRRGSGGGPGRRGGGRVRRGGGAAVGFVGAGLELGLDGERDLERERGDGVEQQLADRGVDGGAGDVWQRRRRRCDGSRARSGSRATRCRGGCGSARSSAVRSGRRSPGPAAARGLPGPGRRRRSVPWAWALPSSGCWLASYCSQADVAGVGVGDQRDPLLAGHG